MAARARTSIIFAQWPAAKTSGKSATLSDTSLVDESNHFAGVGRWEGWVKQKGRDLRYLPPFCPTRRSTHPYRSNNQDKFLLDCSPNISFCGLVQKRADKYVEKEAALFPSKAEHTSRRCRGFVLLSQVCHTTTQHIVSTHPSYCQT